MKFKSTAAVCISALIAATGVFGCSSDGSNKDKKTDARDSLTADTEYSAVSLAPDSQAEENTSRVSSSESSEPPEEKPADLNISYLTAFPESETSLGTELFKSGGGNITYIRCGENEIYDRLSSAKAAGERIDVTDLNELAFPYGCVNGFFQPIDELADLGGELWNGVTQIADNYGLNGFRYVAPCRVTPRTLFYYDKKTAEDLGMGDPLELYSEGKWSAEIWEQMSRAYAASADGRYGAGGADGELERAVFVSTGKTLVRYDADLQGFVNNLFDADLAGAAQMLYSLKADGVIADGDLKPENCAEGGLLFCAASAELYGGRPEGIEAVPPPSLTDDGKYLAQADIISYMWVSGSEKGGAVKYLLECARKEGAEKDGAGFDCEYVCDISGGISPNLNDPESNEEFGAGIIPFIYSAPYENGEWDSICGYFTDAVTGELSALNNEYQKNIFG